MKKLSLIADLYEFIMSGCYFKAGKSDVFATFDLYFRQNPDKGGYAVAAGLENVCDFIDSLRFDGDDIDYLRKIGISDESFLKYLSDFRFTGDIYSVKEGTLVFPNEPILVVRAPIIEAQLIETALLQIINHQTLIATKASRMAYASKGTSVFELGARRAHGSDAAIYGARSAYIGGCSATSCTLAGKLFDLPLVGTMGHSFVQLFDCEYEAFCAYLKNSSEKATLLVDTYDTLNSGIPAAIEAICDIGANNSAIRLDSGDVLELSRKARIMLDNAGLNNCKIVVSGSLDEYKIDSLVKVGAPIDGFGVGESLICAKTDPVLGGVYKLSAVENEGIITPKIKLSESAGKASLPGAKRVLRYYDKDGRAIADEILLTDEPVPQGEHTIFDSDDTSKTKTIKNYTARELLVPVYKNGVRIYESPTAKEIKCYAEKEKETLWSDILKLDSPEKYYVDLSEKLWLLKRKMTGQRRSDFFM